MVTSVNSDPSAKYFSPKVTPRDRAVFEAGIALGMVIHQFTGVPVKNDAQARLLEKVIENSVKAQPFKTDAKVKIAVSKHREDDPFDYETVKARNMDVSIEVTYMGVKVRARLRYVPELDYNLAYIEDIEDKVE